MKTKVTVHYTGGEALELPCRGVTETWDTAHGAYLQADVEYVTVEYPQGNRCDLRRRREVQV